MMLARSRDAGKTWGPAGRAGAFDWNFEGCPHVGGGIAVVRGGRDARILTSVWTGRAESTGAYVVEFGQGGDARAPLPHPLPLPDGATGGRNTDIAAGASDAAVVWDESAAGGQAVFARLADSFGQWSAPRRVSPPGENAAYPRVVPGRDGFMVLYYGPFMARTGRSRFAPDGLPRLKSDRLRTGRPAQDGSPGALAGRFRPIEKTLRSASRLTEFEKSHGATSGDP